VAGMVRERRTAKGEGSLESLHELLADRNADPARAKEIDREINDRFSCRRAVQVLDMLGFSVSTQVHGIIHHLAKIQRMQQIVRREVEGCGGRVLKFEADNAFSVFRNVNSAIRAAGRICDAVELANEGCERSDQIHAAMGIGYGEILLTRDVFWGTR
jgi:adenylate cyclase